MEDVTEREHLLEEVNQMLVMVSNDPLPQPRLIRMLQRYREMLAAPPAPPLVSAVTGRRRCHVSGNQQAFDCYWHAWIRRYNSSTTYALVETDDGRVDYCSLDLYQITFLDVTK
jgi:hypothetical protein